MATTERQTAGEEVAEGVLRIDDGVVNFYLVSDGDQLALVDAGFPLDWSRFTEAVGRLGRSPRDVRDVVLTHGHVDHVGFAERARSELGATVWCHPADRPLTERPSKIAKSERSPLRYLGHGATRALFAKGLIAGAPLAKRVREVSPIADGEVLGSVAGTPRAIHCPGHTDGHCALHIEARGVLFSGDAIVTRNPYTGETGPRIVSGAATKDTRQNLASLDALLPSGAQTVLPGHGGRWREGIGRAVEVARAAGTSGGGAGRSAPRSIMEGE